MNQPLGSCHSYSKGLVRISGMLRQQQSTSQQQNRENQPPLVYTPVQDPFPHDEDQSNLTHHNTDADLMDVDRSDNDPMDVDDPETDETKSDSHSDATAPQYVVEEYPGASQIHGSGPTFMESFTSDSYAKERGEIPYYPFSSKEEWEVAAFLIRSNLSMSAIDEFLSLHLVVSYNSSCFLLLLL